MEHRYVWIAMEDGTRLAARLFLSDRLPAPATSPCDLLRSTGAVDG